MKIPRRSLVTGTAALGALAAMRERADAASVPFTTFAFKATSEPTARTQPDRLAEVKNVKDFGAVGDNSNNDTSAIQAAINWTSAADRGTIFFPPGVYKITAPLTFTAANLTIRFLGSGQATELNGTGFSGGAGFVLDRHLGSPNNTAQVIIEAFQIQNDAVGAASGSIRVGSCSSVLIKDCYVNGIVGVTTEDSAGNSSQNITLQNIKFNNNTNGLIMGGSGSIQGCDFHACTTAATLYGNGWASYGTRMEDNITGYLLGVDSAGTQQGASGFMISGGEMEGNVTFIDFSGPCNGFYIGSMAMLGHATSGPGQNIHTLYGLFVRAGMATNGVFSGISMAGFADVAAAEIDAAASRANLSFIGCSMQFQMGTGVNWIMPSNAYTAWFQNCNTTGVYPNGPIWTYSQLPQTTNVFEGDEFSISDATTNTWGANVTTGGASDHVWVRYNGTNYTVVAK